MNLLVSIIIPTYNRAHIIKETLECLILQSYTNWECLIVDDGSTDETTTIVKSYLVKDPRFQLFIRPENRIKGASTCRNIGLENAKGEFIQFLDSDDLLSPNKFINQIAILKKSKPLTLVTCKWGRFNTIKTLSVREGFNTYKDFNKGIDLILGFGTHNEFFPLMAYLVPKHIIDLAGKWNEQLTNNDDGEFFTRVLLNTHKVIFDETSAVYYRENLDDVKLSALNTNSKILSAIKSWKFIESHIYKKENIQKTLYVERAKQYIYNEIKRKHLKLVLKNSLFFRTQLLNQFNLNNLIKKLF